MSTLVEEMSSSVRDKIRQLQQLRDWVDADVFAQNAILIFYIETIFQ